MQKLWISVAHAVGISIKESKEQPRVLEDTVVLVQMVCNICKKIWQTRSGLHLR